MHTAEATREVAAFQPKSRSSTLLDRVANGHQAVINRRGKAVRQLLPPEPYLARPRPCDDTAAEEIGKGSMR